MWKEKRDSRVFSILENYFYYLLLEKYFQNLKFLNLFCKTVKDNIKISVFAQWFFT